MFSVWEVAQFDPTEGRVLEARHFFASIIVAQAFYEARKMFCAAPYEHLVAVTTDENKDVQTEKARRKALAKLTDAERRILGLL